MKKEAGKTRFIRNPGNQEKSKKREIKIQEKPMALEFEALTEKIIGAAIEVHRRLGPGFIESIYENSLVIELRKRGITVESQVEIAVNYDGLELAVIESICSWIITSSWN